MKIVQKITSPLDCPAFIAAHRQNPQDFTRRRQLTFKNLVLFLYIPRPRNAHPYPEGRFASHTRGRSRMR
ncbi:hypothetical protein EGJ44_22740 [Ectopseudomonas oleovorans]|uniref:Uncharacterized protein n=1 Tax=Ectopseudomonas oleovorans TaxID=301 RepID=A0A427H7I5_ECTOL|nr:hypothetical protein EGJ44_22740 [Pseudomonas oleovorans]